MRVGWRRLVGLAGFLLALPLLRCAGSDANSVEPRPARPPAATANAAPAQPLTPVVAALPDCPALEVELPDIVMEAGDVPVPDIVAPERLERFLWRVARLLRGRADDHVRIAVYGDSNLTMDHMTGAMRRWLQTRHGDAGHGFVALGRPWRHYKHMDVRHDVGGGFASYCCSTDPIFDGMYGISGICAESAYGGAKTWVATAEEGAPIGRTVSRFEIFYLQGPRWGTFDILLDGKPLRSVDSHRDEIGVGVERIDVEDGPHRLTCVANDRRRRVRLLGATLERGSPSFVIDSFGVGAMNTASQAREDPAVNRAMLRQRPYDLIIFATGANDVFTLDVTPGHMKDIIALHREAIPGVPVLILTPSDRGKHRTFPQTLLAVEQRKVIAEDNGCALWDQFAAMGGPGAMRGLKRRGIVRSDYIHLSEAGGVYLGERLLYALLTEVRRYLQINPEAGCDAPGSSAIEGVAKPAE